MLEYIVIEKKNHRKLENIRVILRDNGYSESVIVRGISYKLVRFQLNFALAVIQLICNGNVAPLVGARTTFEIQPIVVAADSNPVCTRAIFK